MSEGETHAGLLIHWLFVAAVALVLIGAPDAANAALHLDHSFGAAGKLLSGFGHRQGDKVRQVRRTPTRWRNRNWTELAEALKIELKLDIRG